MNLSKKEESTIKNKQDLVNPTKKENFNKNKTSDKKDSITVLNAKKKNKADIERYVSWQYDLLLSLDKKQFSNENQKKQIENQRKKIIAKIYRLINILENNEFKQEKKEKLVNYNNPIVSLKNVSKFYSSKKMVTRILDNISLDINERDFVVILGPSGSGKTTLMNLISGIDKNTFGSIRVLNYYLDSLRQKELTSFRKDAIGYVFQRYGLLPNLNVRENIMMGQFLGKKDHLFKKRDDKKIELEKVEEFNKKKDKLQIDSVLEMLELSSIQNKYPYELSGGQKQRVSIARTIAKKPKIIFGDEPTAAVDEDMSKNIVESFSKINSQLGTTIIMITHDERISYYANKVVYILDGKIDKIIDKRKNELIVNENKKN